MCEIKKEMPVSAEEFCRLSFHCQYVIGGDGKMRQREVEVKAVARNVAKIGKEVYVFIEEPSKAVKVCTDCSGKHISDAVHTFIDVHGILVAVPRTIRLFLENTKAVVKIVKV